MSAPAKNRNRLFRPRWKKGGRGRAARAPLVVFAASSNIAASLGCSATPALTPRLICLHSNGMQEPTAEQIDAFISAWSRSGGHERGAGQQFLLEFCQLLDLERPSPPVAENALNSYTFERRVDRRKPDGSSSPNWIDLYKSGHFVLETKQGVNPRRDKSDPDQPLLPDLTASASNTSLGHGHRGSAAWDKALDRAHAQGERYIHLLPPEEGRPPFLIVCDVGHCFDVYAEFSGTGGQYEPFPTIKSPALNPSHSPRSKKAS